MPRKKTEPKPKKLLNNELFERCAVQWSFAEHEVFDVDLKRGEGKGEKSYRLYRGLPQQVSPGPYDVPEFQEEIKCLEKTPGKISARFKLGHSRDSKAFGQAFTEVTRWRDVVYVDPSVTDDFESLVAKKSTLDAMPERLRNIVLELWAPSNVMAKYKAIVLTTSHGFVCVPHSDFDKAFKFAAVSQGRFDYALDWNYLRNML